MFQGIDMIQKGFKRHVKAAALIMALLLMLCACAPKNGNSSNNDAPSGQNGNAQPSNETVPDQGQQGNEADPDAGLTQEEKLYKQLKALCEAAGSSGEGELTTERVYRMTTTSGASTWTSEGTDVYITSFYTDKDGQVEMVRLIGTDGSEAREGELQYQGIKYKYTRTDHDNGTVEWVEGAAETGHKTLPALEALIFDIPELEELESIKFEYSSYLLSVGTWVMRVLSEDSSVSGAYYTLSNVSAEYYLDDKGNLTACSWTFTESWTYEGASVTSDVTANITLENGRTPMASTWFRDNTSYVRPEYPEITETAREAHFNLPGKIILDVRIPKIKDGLPGADLLNLAIEEDCAYELTSDETTLAADASESYIVRRADYSVIKIGKNYEILIDCSIGSAEGSGAATWGHRYFYVPDKGGQVSPEEFLGMMGYDMESFLAAADADEFYTDYSGSRMSEDFTYEELLGMFYFDEDGTLVFVPDVMF